MFRNFALQNTFSYIIICITHRNIGIEVEVASGVGVGKLYLEMFILYLSSKIKVNEQKLFLEFAFLFQIQ